METGGPPPAGGAMAPVVVDANLMDLVAYSSDDQEPQTNGDKEKAPYSYGLDSWRHFYLKQELLRAVIDCGFEFPSTVQERCLLDAIIGLDDLLCQAPSGTGKTAIFVLAILHQLLDSMVQGSLALPSSSPSSGIPPSTATPHKVCCVVVCPTRELACQIGKEFDRMKKYILPPIQSVVTYGAYPMYRHRQLFKDPNPRIHILVATPGRLRHLVEEKVVDLSQVKWFVIDECDKVLGGSSVAMRQDVMWIFRRTPQEKQVMLFASMIPEDLKPLCRRFLRNPRLEYFATTDEAVSKMWPNMFALLPEGINSSNDILQYYVHVAESEKDKKLVDLLDSLEFNQCLIFVANAQHAQRLNTSLQGKLFPSAAIYRGMMQEARLESYRRVKEFRIRIVVATDVMSRGIDIERISIVFNYDMPDDVDTYLHRIGRTGRLGAKGLAISFVEPSRVVDCRVLEDVQRRFGVSISPLPGEIPASSYMFC